MSSSNSTQSSPVNLVAKVWLPADFFAVGLWLHIPTSVYIGRQIALAGARDYSVKLSSWTQFLLGMSSFVMISVFSAIVLLGAMTFGGSKTRRIFIHVALIAGVLVELVYLVSCFGCMMSILHKLG